MCWQSNMFLLINRAEMSNLVTVGRSYGEIANSPLMVLYVGVVIYELFANILLAKYFFLEIQKIISLTKILLVWNS